MKAETWIPAIEYIFENANIRKKILYTEIETAVIENE